MSIKEVFLSILEMKVIENREVEVDMLEHKSRNEWNGLWGECTKEKPSLVLCKGSTSHFRGLPDSRAVSMMRSNGSQSAPNKSWSSTDSTLEHNACTIFRSRSINKGNPLTLRVSQCWFQCISGSFVELKVYVLGVSCYRALKGVGYPSLW